MLARLSLEGLKEELKSLELRDTWLKLDLAGRDPDDGLTAIAYDKGYFFLRMMEERVGREKWDAFLKGYFNKHAFESMTTEGFLAYLNANLTHDADVKKWVYGPGLPADCPEVKTAELAQAAKDARAFLSGTAPWQHQDGQVHDAPLAALPAIAGSATDVPADGRSRCGVQADGIRQRRDYPRLDAARHRVTVRTRHGSAGTVPNAAGTPKVPDSAVSQDAGQQRRGSCQPDLRQSPPDVSRRLTANDGYAAEVDALGQQSIARSFGNWLADI